jgi:antitoxin (DNA-binding transcriptional repressor) of toxin-antitoxin stability system
MGHPHFAFKFSKCDARMYHMRKANVRDLRYRFPEVEAMLREGEEIQITKRKRVIAWLVPNHAGPPVRRPDFLGRLKKIYGSKTLKVAGSDLLARERERY